MQYRKWFFEGLWFGMIAAIFNILWDLATTENPSSKIILAGLIAIPASTLLTFIIRFIMYYSKNKVSAEQ